MFRNLLISFVHTYVCTTPTYVTYVHTYTNIINTYQQHIRRLDHYCLLLSMYLIVQTNIDTQCYFYDHSSLCSLLLDYYCYYLHYIHLVCHHLWLVLHRIYTLLSMLVRVDCLKVSLMYTIAQHLDQVEQ